MNIKREWRVYYYDENGHYNVSIWEANLKDLMLYLSEFGYCPMKIEDVNKYEYNR